MVGIARPPDAVMVTRRTRFGFHDGKGGEAMTRAIGNRILGEYGTTIFTVMSALALEHGAVNLGQGFPDEDGPEDIREAAARAILEGPNQYPPMMGLPALRHAVAEHDRRFHGLDLDWGNEVMVTSGATEALADGVLGLIEPGDEVILIEPLYDSYLPMIRRAGGVPRLVRMEPPGWELPRQALTRAFSKRTRLIIVNSPHNPSGKVFDADELAFIADLCREYDVVALCDEVYEHLTFDRARHIPLMTLPDMRERAVRIGSAGKTFSLTGWKVGTMVAAPALLQPIAKAHQFNTFTTPPALQIATAVGLGKEDAYFTGLAAALAGKRDRLAAGLRSVGFEVLPSRGTYFLTVDIRKSGFVGGDAEFCRRLTVEAGVTAVPVSAFYREDGPDHLVRFCFCKRDAVLDEAVARLERRWR